MPEIKIDNMNTALKVMSKKMKMRIEKEKNQNLMKVQEKQKKGGKQHIWSRIHKFI